MRTLKKCLLSASLFFGFACCAFCGGRAMLEGKNFAVEFKGGDIFVLNGAGEAQFSMSRAMLYYTGGFGKAAEASIEGGAMRVRYDFPKLEGASAEAVIRVSGGEIDVKYKVSAPAERLAKLQGLTQYFQAAAAGVSIADGVLKNGIWTRVEGGTPYEKRGSYAKIISAPGGVFAAKITGNPYYCGGNRCTVGMSREGASASGGMRIVFVPDGKDFEAGAVLDGQKFALKISTDAAFNIFESAPEFRVDAASIGGAEAAELSVKAYDFDGRAVVDEKSRVEFKGGAKVSRAFKLPDGGRGIFFVEAALRGGGAECFTRSNVAVLPPHKYRNAGESRIGLSGNFRLDKRPDVARLWNRIGARLNRSGDNSKTKPLGVVSFFACNEKPDVKFDPEKHAARVSEIVETMRLTGAPWLEFGNEWSTSGDARRNMELKRARAANYAAWLRAIRAEMNARGMRGKFKIMSVSTGGAGGDTKFLQMLADEGVWDLLDAVCFHPGRGPVCADKTGGGWTFLGGVQNMKRKIAELGKKPLLLTEVYASCQPNNAWCDSYRLAAENLLMSIALGYAEDIAGIFVFKFNDGISWDVNGPSETDREFHYGVMMRDFSPKPSMMAMATAAEHLDGAKFSRLIEAAGTSVKAYEFDSPRGVFHVIVDRKDGYDNPRAEAGGKQVHLEPWIDPWKSHTEYAFAAAKQNVYVYDTIGREKKLAAKNGAVKIVLSGSPLIVYGLKF